MSDTSKILIVEDDVPNMELAAYVLASGGYQLLQAANAADGIALARKERPALVLMDLRLPGMDGLSAIRALKADAQTSGIKIIVVTSYSSQYGEEAKRSCGADAFVLKPFHHDSLLAAVRAVLGS